MIIELVLLRFNHDETYTRIYVTNFD